jgi:hypothetical protein
VLGKAMGIEPPVDGGFFFVQFGGDFREQGKAFRMKTNIGGRELQFTEGLRV